MMIDIQDRGIPPDGDFLCGPVVRAIVLLFFALLGSLHSASATDFSVLSYNVFLRAPTWVFHDEHDWRTERIPYFLSGYDAVILQEAFSKQHRNVILKALKAEYPYNSDILGEDEFLSFKIYEAIL